MKRIALSLLVLAASVIAADHDIDISGFAYDPDTLTVQVGDTVTWTNQDSAAHTVTADNADFDSGSLAQGETWSFTFDSAGTWDYHCTFHPMMTAVIIVEDSSAVEDLSWGGVKEQYR